jgi:hypothetical protein
MESIKGTPSVIRFGIGGGNQREKHQNDRERPVRCPGGA